MRHPFVLGTLIGLERQWRQRTAELRTIVLVAVGAAGFADLGMRLLGTEGATRIISYVVSGIGFLGAGVILKDGTNMRGLNTAASYGARLRSARCPAAGCPLKQRRLQALCLQGTRCFGPSSTGSTGAPSIPT